MARPVGVQALWVCLHPLRQCQCLHTSRHFSGQVNTITIIGIINIITITLFISRHFSGQVQIFYILIDFQMFFLDIIKSYKKNMTLQYLLIASWELKWQFLIHCW